MTVATWMAITLCTVATLAAGATRNRVPVVVSMIVGAVLRIVFAAMASQRFTPRDTRVSFRATGELIWQGRDPLHDMPGRQWNFLELMPYVHALELHSGLPWVYALKIAPIASDVVLVWMVAQLVPRDGRTRALQYALNPLSLLVVSLHGQVEPVALALALGGVLLLRKDRPELAGVLLGAAVAAKTWPAIILLAVLPLRDPRRAARIIIGSAVIPLLCVLSGAIFLDTHVVHDLVRLTSYSSFVLTWTWSGVLIEMGHATIAGYDSSVSGWASAFILVGLAVTLFLVRRRPPEVRALCALCAVLICTAGFGPQYLLWVLPLTIALAGSRRYGYLVASTTWAAIAYLSPFVSLQHEYTYLRGLSWLPAIMLLALVVEQVVDFSLPSGAARRQAAEPEPQSGLDSPGDSPPPAEGVRSSTNV